MIDWGGKEDSLNYHQTLLFLPVAPNLVAAQLETGMVIGAENALERAPLLPFEEQERGLLTLRVSVRNSTSVFCSPFPSASALCMAELDK